MSEDEFAFVHDQEEFNDVNEERIQYLMGMTVVCILYITYTNICYTATW